MIFDGITPTDGNDCVRLAVSAISAHAKARGLWTGRVRWSLAELAPDDTDLVWLRNWVLRLRGITLLTWLNSWESHPEVGLTGAGSIGLLLMMLASESARREATEGTLWPTVEREYAGDIRRLLFLHGQPTEEHKQALQSAAWDVGLRHVFGIDGLQNWLISVYLQFGFTRRGFEGNLPIWLTAPQNRSNAVLALLNGPMQSASFQQLWNALENYRRRNISVAHLYSLLEQNPWILPEWWEKLTRLAQTKMHLGGGHSETQSAKPLAAPEFLNAPILRWNGEGQPVFVCHWQQLTELSLPNDQYTLIIDGQERAKLRRHAEGGFTAYPDGELHLPTTASQTAVLLDADQNVALTQVVTCWDNAEDITAFQLPAGDRLADAWTTPLKPGSAYVLVFAADLTLDPPAVRWQMTPDGYWRFALLPPSRSPELRVLVPDGACLWQPAQPASFVTDWTAAISVSVANRAIGRRWGETLMVDVNHPADVSVDFVRCHGQTLGCAAIENGTRVGPLTLVPGPRELTPELILGLSHGTFHACRRRSLPLLNLAGALHLVAGERRPLGPKTILTTTMAQNDAFQLFGNQSWNPADIALFEGDLAVGKPPMRPAALPRLAGFGAPLSLRARAYNDREEPLIIAQEVINPGHMTSITHEITPEARCVKVHFRYPVEPGPGHSLFWWGHDGMHHLISAAKFHNDPERGTWVLHAPLAWGEPLVVAAAFEGARLGAWWADDWQRLLDCPSIALETAALVRWVRLPILSSRSRQCVQQFAWNNAAVVLAAWLNNAGLPDGFQWGLTDERWFDALRQIFYGWKPTVSEARSVLRELAPAGDDMTLRLQSAARLLLRADPHLTARVFGVWLREFSVLKYTLAETRAISNAVGHALAETTGNVEERATQLLKEVAITMACDDNFVKRGLLEKAVAGFTGQHLLPSDQSNIALALAVMPFRRLLAVRLLQNACP